MGGYQTITDIAAANSAIAELYGQTDALMRRMGGMLGETADTAYRGDRGKIAYDHSQITSGNPHGITPSSIGAMASNASTQFTGVPVISMNDARINFNRPSGGASAWQGLSFYDNGVIKGGFYYNFTDGEYYLDPNVSKKVWHTGTFNPANYAPLNNPTITASNSGEGVHVKGVAGISRGYLFHTDTNLRWFLYEDGGSESGSNAGSNFNIARYNDAGTFIDNPFSINRASGITTFAKRIVLPSGYANCCFQMGSVYMWVNNSTGRLMWKVGAPASDSDGQMFALS